MSVNTGKKGVKVVRGDDGSVIISYKTGRQIDTKHVPSVVQHGKSVAAKESKRHNKRRHEREKEDSDNDNDENSDSDMSDNSDSDEQSSSSSSSSSSSESDSDSNSSESDDEKEKESKKRHRKTKVHHPNSDHRDQAGTSDDVIQPGVKSADVYVESQQLLSKAYVLNTARSTATKPPSSNAGRIPKPTSSNAGRFAAKPLSPDADDNEPEFATQKSDKNKKTNKRSGNLYDKPNSLTSHTALPYVQRTGPSYTIRGTHLHEHSEHQPHKQNVDSEIRKFLAQIDQFSPSVKAAISKEEGGMVYLVKQPGDKVVQFGLYDDLKNNTHAGLMELMNTALAKA